MARQQSASIFHRVEGLPIILVFVLLLILFMYLAPQVFLQPFQYTTFLSTLPPLILLAVGLTFIIGAGEIDLCFPAILGFSGFIFAVIFKDGQPWLVAMFEQGEDGWLASWFAGEIIQWLAVILALLAGILVGVVNGILVAKIGIPSFIATLGTQFFWYGMATVLSGGKSYALRGAEESSVWQVLVGRPFASSSVDWLSTGPDPGAVDGDHRRLRCGSSSTATASASTRSSSAIRTRYRAWSASMSTARRSSCSR